MRLTDRVVVITGGARGIGGATARLCAAEGAKIVIGDMLEAEGANTVAEIRQAGGQALFVKTNVTNDADCGALMAAAIEAHGKIDVLVCAAGILRGAFQQVDVLDEATYMSVIEVNLKGDFLCARNAVPHMRKTGSGVILLFASVAGVRQPSSSLAYGSSKGGVHGFAMTLEAQLADSGIRVNDICPGSIDTDMKRENVLDAAKAHGQPTEGALSVASLASPDGVARLVTFLASADADYVRGTVFTR